MINFNATKEEILLIKKIAKRALRTEAATDLWRDLQDCLMDIEACHCNGTPLDLKKLAEADDFNFCHDVYGIAQHLDRTTGKLQNHFLPRCAA